MENNKQIISESPVDHWFMLPVKGKIVLDLGSGIWDHSLPTPIYFLQQGAEQVIGVDGSHQSYEWFEQNLQDDRFIQHMDMIDSKGKFELFLGHYRPDVIKCDVEGGELHLASLNPSLFVSVMDMAIEYHDPTTKFVSEQTLKNNGFTLEYYEFPGIDPKKQGVVYGTKVKEQTDFFNNLDEYHTK
jgi:hypothetical protein